MVLTELLSWHYNGSTCMYNTCLKSTVCCNDTRAGSQLSLQAHDALTMSPYFFLDMLYAHEPPDLTNMCEVSKP